MKQERAFYLVQKINRIEDLVSRLDFKEGIRGMAQGLRENGHSVLLRIEWEEVTKTEEYAEATLVCIPPITEEEISLIKFAGYDIYPLSKIDYERISKQEITK